MKLDGGFRGASCDTDDMLQRLHRGSDDRLVSGHGDAFADRRHRSGGSRAHRVDEEQTISRPTCRRHLMLPRTCLHDGMFRRLCAASLAACGLARECSPAVSFPECTAAAGPALARYPTRHGVRWRVLPACADGGRLAALSSPAVASESGSDDTGNAAGSSASAVECSHGVTWSER